MDWTLLFGGLALGLLAGVLGGVFGIGGGLVMVPAMILIFAFPTKTATGTSLMAQVLPVGILGVIEYYRMGHVRVGFGISMALGLLFGIFAGSLMAGLIPAPVMKRAYGVFLVLCGGYFLFAPSGVSKKEDPAEIKLPTEPNAEEADQEVQ